MRSELALLSLLVTCGCAQLRATANNPTGSSRVVVAHVSGRAIQIDEQPVATEPVALKRALAGAGGDTVIIEGDASADDRVVALVVEQAQTAPQREIRLELPDLLLLLRARVYSGDRLRHDSLLVFVSEQARAWLVHNSDGSFEDLGHWSLDGNEQELAGTIARACAAGCNASLSIESGRPFVPITRKWLRLTEPSGLVSTDLFTIAAAPLAIQSTTGPVSGRLAPELIQAIVRARFGGFRNCYEQGLKRNPELKGRVSARFVIGLDGKVSDVRDASSDIPDTAVRDCVLDKFNSLVFPQPEGGIVVVVYPILLAPG